MVKKIAIVTPTYNEAKNIETLISSVYKVCSKIKGITFSLFVVDDLSPDHTADIADRAAKKYSSANFKVVVLRRHGKRGIGNAYVYGFNKVIKNGDYDYVIQMDADSSHNPKYISEFIRLAQTGHDFVVASRYVRGGSTPGWGLHRRILSHGGNLYTKLILGGAITDYTGGYNMYSLPLLKTIDPSKLSAGGYGFQIQLKYIAMQKASPVQFPVVFTDRQHGKSKMPKNTLIKNLFLVIRIKSAR